MMPRPKGPKTEKEGIRLRKDWLEALDEEVEESDGEYANRAELIRKILFRHIEARKNRKKR